MDGVYYNFGDDGKSQGKYTGLMQIEGKWYYSKLGTLTGGWVQIGDNWHCFYYSNKQAITGERKLNGVTYKFDEKGMTRGAWYTDDIGTRFYYSNTYYVARNPGYMTLHEIDGKTYNFDNDGYLTYGIQALRDSTSFKKYVFEFDTDGALVRKITEHGTIEIPGDGIYYINEDGYVPMNAGLVQCGNDFYYVVYSGKVKTNASIYIKDNPLVPDGTYSFGADGKMTTVVNGIYFDGSDYYYKQNGVIQKNLGLIEFEGDYYFVCYSGKLKIGTKYVTDSTSNGLLPAGSYTFGVDGKMIKN